MYYSKNVSCKHCGTVSPTGTINCPRCLKPYAKVEIKHLIGIIIFFISLSIIIYFLDLSILEERKIEASLSYLNNFDNIELVIVSGRSIYLGFNTIPENLKQICDEAAIRSSEAIQKDIYIWGIDANIYDKNWNKRNGEYQYKSFVRYSESTPQIPLIK